jgi:hypothetical protein
MMKTDVFAQVNPDRVRMNWHRAQWHVARMGQQCRDAVARMDLLTVLKLDEAAWRYINQFEADVNRRHLRAVYESNSGQAKPAGFLRMTMQQFTDERFAQANSDFINDSWYEEADAEG